MKIMILILSVAFLTAFVGCAGKEEVSLDTDMGAASAPENEDVKKDDLSTIEPGSSASEAGLEGAPVDEPAHKPKAKKAVKASSGTKLTAVKECKIRVKASPSAKVLRKLKSGQSVSAIVVNKAWYKLSHGGFVPRSCFR